MSPERDHQFIAPEAPILVTGGAGFIGFRVVQTLLERNFRRIRCLVRPSSRSEKIHRLAQDYPKATVDLLPGNLLSRSDCAVAVKDAAVIYHLAAGTGTKSFPDAFMNSVVTTRNLLDAAVESKSLKRFVSLSSFAVYDNRRFSRRTVLDETRPMEARPELRGEAYCYAKVKQDELVIDYGRRKGLPYVILRPGVVYGPEKRAMIGRIGLGTFGIFLHLGGFNQIPLTYVENCAEAVVLAGLKPGVDCEIINVVDDDLPSSRRLLRDYKKHVKSFHSIYLPSVLCYLFCAAWEEYSRRSHGQLPPMFNRLYWHAYWKGSRYSNDRLKHRLGWTQRVPTAEGLSRYFQSCRAG